MNVVAFLIEDQEVLVIVEGTEEYLVVATEDEYQSWVERMFCMDDFIKLDESFDDDGYSSIDSYIDWDLAQEKFYCLEYIQKFCDLM